MDIFEDNVMSCTLPGDTWQIKNGEIKKNTICTLQPLCFEWSTNDMCSIEPVCLPNSTRGTELNGKW